MHTEILHKLIIYQKSYFEILSEFFINFTGKTPDKFQEFEDVVNELKLMSECNKNNIKFFSNLASVREDFLSKLSNLYASDSAQVFQAAKDLDAFKINIGGSSRFLKTQLNAVRKSLLITDIVLIPDPILPWLETEREEEKLKNLKMIEAIYFILNLKDLFEEDFEIPPFFIFPSWEKLLEEKDTTTKQNLNLLLLEFLSFYLNVKISSQEELTDYLSKYSNDFLNTVQEKRLFISPNGMEISDLRDSIESYKDFAQQYRTDEWCRKYLSSDLSIVINGLAERLVPQYHLFENSKEINSNPYLCIPEHAYYYNLISKMSWGFSTADNFDKQAIKLLKVLSSKRLDYLANIDNHEMKMLRKSDEHILFKNDMRAFVSSMGEVKTDDIDYMSREFSQFLDAKVKQHTNELESLKKRYAKKHQHTLMLAGSTLAVNFMPLFGQLMSVLGAGSVGLKYLSDKVDETYDLNNIKSSYTGVIALAKQRS